MKTFTTLSIAAFLVTSAFADITISIDANKGTKKISPYIYGRNIDVISDGDENIPQEEQDFIDKMLDAGIHMLRANNGNNATRYNWRKKLTVHPDWYNNVYKHDWGITAKKVQDNMPGIDAMYAFQLTGYAASSKDYNFADWDFSQKHGKRAKSTLDLAGGGEVDDDGETLIKAGDYKLYNEAWPADSTVGIIDYWSNELRYDMSRFKYWSMDNEMDIWNSTHGDLPLNIDADFLVERYIDVAKKARAKWNDIKLTGPVAANEWFWCSISASDKDKNLPKGEDRKYCWLEYFIKRVADAQKTSGIRLLDVFDIHWYPTEKNFEDQVNWHRVFFDTTYNYPGANGIKLVNGSWDNGQSKEYIFKRINDWLEKYFGKDHGITLALTETSIGKSNDAMTTAIVYASWLGTFMDNGVEILTPWTWSDGMYETVHLFSRYGHENRVESVSSNDSIVSAYTSISQKQDSMTVIFVNRSENDSQNVTLDVSNFKLDDGTAKTLMLAELSGETFESHTSNALKQGNAEIKSNKVALTLPAKSITAILLEKADSTTAIKTKSKVAKLYFSNGSWFIDNQNQGIKSVTLLNSMGQKVWESNNVNKGQVKLLTSGLVSGQYIACIRTAKGFENHKISIR